jgi:hypothetical protein
MSFLGRPRFIRYGSCRRDCATAVVSLFADAQAFRVYGLWLDARAQASRTRTGTVLRVGKSKRRHAVRAHRCIVGHILLHLEI